MNSLLLAFSPLHFGPAWFAAGAAAASVPVLIHLIMRTRPRVVEFPAIRFVLRTHQAHISMHLLKHLLLLLLRMGALALLALFLSRPLWQAADWMVSSDEPAAVVLALDTSYSMDYVHQGQTRLQHAKAVMAAALETFPPGSRFAVIRNDDPGQAPPWTDERSPAAADLAAAKTGLHARGVGQLLTRAYAALADPAQARFERKVILLGNDLTARSWADVQPGMFTQEGKVECYLVDASVAQNLNVALLEPTAEPPVCLPGGAVVVSVPTRIAEAAHAVKVDLALAGPFADSADGLAPRLRDAQWVDHSRRELRFALPGQQIVQSFDEIIRRDSGPYFGRLQLVGGDALEADNTRWVAFRVDRLPVALVVGQPGRGTAADLVANAIAPDTPGWRARRTIDVRRMTAAELMAADLAGADTIWLAGAGPLEEGLWPKLTTFVRNGGTVIFIPGAGSRISDLASPAAEQFLGVAKVRDVPLAEPAAVQLAPADYRHGLLSDFEGGRRGDLANVLVRRAWAFDVAGAGRITLGRVPLEQGASTPLIVLGAVGKGRVLLWSTGPQREWSNLAPRPEFLVLVQSSIKYLTGQYRVVNQFLLGEPVQFPLPRDWPPVGSTAQLHLPDGTDRPVPVDPQLRTVLGAADQVGPHVILIRRSSEDRSGLLIGYAVNSDPAESDLTLLDRAKLANASDPAEGFFDASAFSIAADADALRRSQALRTRGVDISPLLALAMLILLCGESFFANRFYRRPPPAAETLETTRNLQGGASEQGG